MHFIRMSLSYSEQAECPLYSMLKRLTNLAIMALGVLLLGVAESGCSSSEPVAHPTWTTSLPLALAQARTEHKLVLMDFTGSDWCVPCRELHDQVLETLKFKNYADTNLVLVVVDFPERKPLTDEQQQANDALKKQFDVPGYPTLILLDADGKVLSKKLGYDDASDLIADLEKKGKGG